MEELSWRVVKVTPRGHFVTTVGLSCGEALQMAADLTKLSGTVDRYIGVSYRSTGWTPGNEFRWFAEKLIPELVA